MALASDVDPKYTVWNVEATNPECGFNGAETLNFLNFEIAAESQVIHQVYFAHL